MILFSHFSLLVLAVAIASFVAFIEVSRSNLIDDRRTWLKHHLGFTLLFNLVLFADHSIYTLDTRYFYILRYPTVLLIAISYVELSYAAAGYGGTRHRKIYRIIVGLASLAWAYGLYKAVSSGASYYSSAYNILLPLPILMFWWPGLLFWFGFKKQGFSITPFSNFKVLWASFSYGQKAAFAFWGVALLRILSTTTPVLERTTNLPQEATWTLFYVNNLLTLSAMTIIFHAFIEKRANLASRIANVLTVAILSAFMVVVLLSYTDKTPLPSDDIAVISQHSLEFSPSMNGYSAVVVDPEWEDIAVTRHAAELNKPINVALPFKFPFYGKHYGRLTIYPDGQVVPSNDTAVKDRPLAEVKLACIYDQPVIAPFCLPNSHYEIFTSVADDTDTVVLMWAYNVQKVSQKQDFVVQLVLSTTGKITVNFSNVPTAAAIARHNAIGIHSGNGIGAGPETLAGLPIQSAEKALWFDFTYGRRAAAHELLKPLVMFLAFVIALVLLVIRPYIITLIVAPLEHIRRGVKAVDEGQFDSELKVRRGDEFGDVAAGFNTMLSSLNEARQRYDEQTDLLESELTFRTIEAAKKIDPDILSKDQVFEQNLRSTIEDNMGNPGFQVAELADAMATSTRQLHRRVVNLTAQTPAALIKNLRLEQGHMLLSAKAVTVSEAAYKVGFRDVSYFTRLFQKKYDITPSDLLKA